LFQTEFWKNCKNRQVLSASRHPSAPRPSHSYPTDS